MHLGYALTLTVMSSTIFRDGFRHYPMPKGGSDFDNMGVEAGWWVFFGGQRIREATDWGLRAKQASTLILFNRKQTTELKF